MAEPEKKLDDDKLSAPLGQTTAKLYPSSDEEGEIRPDDPLTHREAMEKYKDGLAELIVGDPLLSDLPSGVTLEELKAQMALHYGQAMTVNVLRDDGHTMPVVVEQRGTVRDLKAAIKRYMSLKLTREGVTKNISWRYIWRTYWLYFDTQNLTEDKKPLKEYGIHNKAEVKFVKKMKAR